MARIAWNKGKKASAEARRNLSEAHKGYKHTDQHILAFSRFPAHRFDVDNGLTLCISCHKKTNNYAGKASK